jgi:hypothetical protein
MDSGGLAVILSLVAHSEPGGWVGAINPNKDVRRLFDIIGLGDDRGFRVFAGIQEAEAAVRGEGRGRDG